MDGQQILEINNAISIITRQKNTWTLYMNFLCDYGVQSTYIDDLGYTSREGEGPFSLSSANTDKVLEGEQKP